LGSDVSNSLFHLVARALLAPGIGDGWSAEARPEGARQKVFSTLLKASDELSHRLAVSLGELASRSASADTLALLAAFCEEFRNIRIFDPQKLIPLWQEGGPELARHSLSAFYAFSAPLSIAGQLQCFLDCIGASRLFERPRCLFKQTLVYHPFGEYWLRRLLSEDIKELDRGCEDLLSSANLELVVPELIRRSKLESSPFALRDEETRVALRHFASETSDRRKYLLGWLVLMRALRHPALRMQTKRRITRTLRALASRSSEPQRFYASLLLRTPSPAASAQQLSFTSEAILAAIFDAAGRIARRRRKAPVRDGKSS